MAIEDSVPSGFLSQQDGTVTCPSCGQGESVHAVPAVYESARATEETIARARRTANDDDASLARKRAARQQLAATPPPTVGSGVLAPAPKSRVGAFLAGTVMFALLAGVLTVMYNSSKGFTDSTGLDADGSGSIALHTFSIACTALSGLCLVGFAFALIRQLGIKRGRPAAEAVWRRGWYCGRCAVVYFRSGEQPTGIDAGRQLTPAEFRHLVWSAGGYAKAG